MEHRLLLRAVMSGARGPELAEELGLTLDDVADHEDEFITVMRISVYEAAIDVLSKVRRRRKSFFGLDTGTND